MRLPSNRTFVVRLSDQVDPAARVPVGRIEHVESGVGGRFHSLEEMRAFMARVLAAEESENGMPSD